MGLITKLRYYLIKLFSSELYFYKDDMTIYLTPITTNVYFNSADERLAHIVKKYSDKQKILIDVGAYIGGVGIPASKYYHQVHCFEPIPSHKGILDLNITSNNAMNIISYNYSLGEENKPVLFVVNKRSNDDSGFKVLQRTGDSFNFKDVGFIKIDVDGYEFEVIKGFTETIKRDKPIIVLESNSGNDWIVHPLMESLGYELIDHFKDNELWINAQLDKQDDLKRSYKTKGDDDG